MNFSVGHYGQRSKSGVLLFLSLGLFPGAGHTQEKRDSTKLPFAIADEKRLDNEDLRNKKEGSYLTGAPDFSSDPVNGIGYGGEGSIFLDGKRSDPFFQYTAYRMRIDFVAFNTTKSQREFSVKLDIPYIFDTKWRLRVEGAYEANPNLLYFGQTAKESLQGLSYLSPSGTLVTDGRYSDYEKYFLVGPNQFYNNYFKREGVLNVTLERSFFESKLRSILGFEVGQVNMSVFSGNSLLRDDSEAGRVLGLRNQFVTISQVGLTYDTRDLEPDPSHGVMIEIANELSLKALGSTYDFDKVFFHANYYQGILSSVFPKLIFAGRIGIGYTGLNAPFYEYQDEWSTEGSIEGLGGPLTLRGYKQSRFLGRIMNFDNFELRWRFAQTNIFKQHLAFSAVPLMDIGGVWDQFSRLDFNNLRYSEGMGLRIAWNVNTILRFDYAWSKEDAQFFFNLAQAF